MPFLHLVLFGSKLECCPVSFRINTDFLLSSATVCVINTTWLSGNRHREHTVPYITAALHSMTRLYNDHEHRYNTPHTLMTDERSYICKRYIYKRYQIQLANWLLYFTVY